jgi:hypothetical protein
VEEDVDEATLVFAPGSTISQFVASEEEEEEEEVADVLKFAVGRGTSSTEESCYGVNCRRGLMSFGIPVAVASAVVVLGADEMPSLRRRRSCCWC